MTPPRAATPAGRRTAAPRTPTRAPQPRRAAPREEVRITASSSRAISGAARAAVRASAAAAVRDVPVAPRRVSGPLSGRIAAAAAAVALPQRAPVPLPAPRRRPVPVTRPARRDQPAGARALGWIRALPDHRLLDRLIGGRVWIVLIGTLLVGLVTVQLSLLKLNAGIGRAVERTALLTQHNAALRADISELSNSERVTALASQMGFVTPEQGTPRFRSASADNASKALVVMRVPQQSTTTSASTITDTAGTGTSAATDPGATDPTAPTDTTTGVSTTATSTDTTATTAAPTVPASAPTTSTPTTSVSGAAPTSGTTATAGSTTVGGGATAPTP